MELILISAILFYGVIFFLDSIFRSCMFFPYIKLMNDNGISIKPFMISWESTRFNRCIWRWGHSNPILLRKWFQCGSDIISLCIFPVLIVLTYPLFLVLFSSNVHKKELIEKPYLVPVIPGYNIPGSHLPYYLVAIFVSLVVHEFGHALAASREKIPMEGWGIALFAIFPIAYVRLPTELLRNIGLPQQLRIYAAGIWHNVTLGVFTALLLGANPILLRFFYQSGTGVTVTNVREGSSLSNLGGLKEGDHVISVNDCPILNSESWKSCLQNINVERPKGFCTTQLFINEHDISGHDGSCCKNSSENICFKFSMQQAYQEACLPTRKLAKEHLCENNNDCSELCALPVLEPAFVKFVNIKRMSGPPVLFIGNVEEIISCVYVIPWTKKVLPVILIEIYETILIYTQMFTFGIAVINLVPWFWMDGQHLAECVINNYLSNIIPNSHRRSLLVLCSKFAGCVAFFSAIYIPYRDAFIQTYHH